MGGTMKKYIFVWCAISLVGCSEDARFLEAGKRYFECIDEGKPELAYELITERDKQAVSVEAFSQEIRRLQDEMYSPAAVDGGPKTVLRRVLHGVVQQMEKDGLYFLGDGRNVCEVHEILRVPDVKAVESLVRAGKSMEQSIQTGDCPTVLDSSRCAIVVLEDGEPRISVGARAMLVNDSLLTMYKILVRNGLTIHAIGKGEVYKAGGDEIAGKIKYRTRNLTPDTFRDIKLLATFKGIPTDTIHIMNPILPRVSDFDYVFFSSKFLSHLLGHLPGPMEVDADIRFARTPIGNGPLCDSIMGARPNGSFEELNNPIRQGISRSLF
jgi:hypothetical protein